MPGRQTGSTRRAAALLAEPSHVGEMASALFCESLRDDLRLDLLLDVHLAQSPVLLFELLHASHERSVHAAKLGSPLVERCRADTQFTTELGDCQARLCSLECVDDLAVGET